MKGIAPGAILALAITLPCVIGSGRIDLTEVDWVVASVSQAIEVTFEILSNCYGKRGLAINFCEIKYDLFKNKALPNEYYLSTQSSQFKGVGG